MSQLKSAATKHPERRAAPTVTRAAKPALQRILIVAESEQDLAWLGRMKAMSFDPILMFSNFDAVQRMTEELDLKLVLFAQRSLMMDGITACQLLRQSRSEADVAIVLLLDDNLEPASHSHVKPVNTRYRTAVREARQLYGDNLRAPCIGVALCASMALARLIHAFKDFERRM